MRRNKTINCYKFLQHPRQYINVGVRIVEKVANKQNRRWVIRVVLDSQLKGNSGWNTAVSVLSNSFVAYNRAFPTTRPARGTPAMFYGSPRGVHARVARGFEISRRSAPQPCGNTRQFLAHLFRLPCGKTYSRTLETNSPFVSAHLSLFCWLFDNVTRAFQFVSLAANFRGDSINIHRKLAKSVDNRREILFLRALRIST